MNIYQRIKEWVEQRKTGQIALNVSEGRILNAEVKEKLLAK
jgi:hypothetical protein